MKFLKRFYFITLVALCFGASLTPPTAFAGGNNHVVDTNDQHSCNLAGYNGGECTANCQHMARWWVSEPYITLWLEDEPIGYQPSRGSRMAFHLSFKQRDTRPETNLLFSFGKNWESSWLSRVSLTNLLTGQSGICPACYAIADYDATVYLPGGGASLFSGTNETGDVSAQTPKRINQTRF